MKKLAQTIGLLTLMLIVTSFTTPNETGGGKDKPVPVLYSEDGNGGKDKPRPVLFDEDGNGGKDKPTPVL